MRIRTHFTPHFTPVSALAFSLVALTATASQASVITTNCANADFCFVRELFAGGTIQVDDKLFDAWGSLVNLETDALLSTRVFGLDDQPLNTGIAFVSNLSVSAPNDLFFGFSYAVSVLDPSLFITDASLDLVSVDISGQESTISISEAVFDPGITTTLAALEVSNTDPSDSGAFAPQQEIAVFTKGFLVPGLQKGNLVKLNRFEQRFSQTPGDAAVPEPSAALLFAGGALLTWRAVRNRRQAAR